MKGHTPGAWRYHAVSGCILGPSAKEPDPDEGAPGDDDIGHVVCTGAHWWDTPGRIAKKADAYLIAAAPDLLAALKALIAVQAQDEEPYWGDAERNAYNAAWAAAHAAIDKAEGGAK